jgi:hypothetical protein
MAERMEGRIHSADKKGRSDNNVSTLKNERVNIGEQIKGGS